MTAPQTSLRAYAMLTVVMLLWAGNSIVARAIHGVVPPFTLALVRWMGALLIVAPFALRHFGADKAALRAHWKIVLALGLAGVAAFNAFLYSGLRHTTAVNALLLQAAIPAGVLLCNFLFFGTRSPVGQVVGILLSTIGVCVVVSRAEIETFLHLNLGTGEILVLCGVVAWSIYTALLRLKPAVHPLSLLLATFLIAVIAMAPLAATEWREAATIPLTAPVLAAFAYVAILPSVVAYLLYNRAVGEIGAVRAGQTISLMPLFGALLSALLLGEQLHLYHLAGMAMILGGVVITAVASRS